MAYQTSQGLASLGRNGDSMLVHMNPTEVAGLQSLAMSQGGSLTINPHTGLPEAFSLSGVFSSLLPMFAGAMFPGAGFAMQPLLAGALTGGVLAKVQGKDPLMGGLMGGLGGIGGSNLAQGLGGAASGAAAGTPSTYSLAGGYVDPSTIGAMVGPQAPGTALANTGLQSSQSMMMNPVVRNAVQATQQAGGILPNTGSFMDKELTALANSGRGASALMTGQPGAVQGFKNAFIDPTTGTGALSNTGMAMKIGMPVGGALLGGLEPSDLYGEPINMDEAKKKQAYNPNATLNLSGDTGLRLYATGGTIQSGGIRDLYGTPDNQPTISPGLSGFGLGRLNNLAGEQAMTQAQTLGYAEGGDVGYSDIAKKYLTVSLDEPMSKLLGRSVSNLPTIGQGLSKLYPEFAPTYERIAAGEKGMNSVVAGEKGMNLDNLPTLNVNTGTSMARGGYLNGYADGGDVVAGERGMNLDDLPSLNVETGKQGYGGKSYYMTPDGSGMYAGKFFKDVYRQNPDAPPLFRLFSRLPNDTVFTRQMAQGGPVSFADGGDSNKEDALGLPSLSPDMSMDPNAGASNLAMLQSAMQPTQGMQGNAPMTQGQMPDQSNDSLIAKVTANLRADPNYQPTNPIEASIVKQIRGTDPMQQGQPSLQGLGSLGPSQPMAPSYSPSVAMGPTYFAGINAPQGYAEGGETSLNLDELPTLNVETGKQSYNTIQSALANSDNPQGRLLNKLFSFRPGGGQSIYDQFAAKGLKRLNNSQMAKGGYLDGQGDGMSDSIPATIEGKQPARLADGEFVVPADVVSHLGNGSSKAGSKRLYAMLDKVRHARTGNKKQGKQIKPEKYMPA